MIIQKLIVQKRIIQKQIIINNTIEGRINMEEAMNLNGMGQLNNQQVPQIPIPQQPQEQETKVEPVENKEN